MFCLANAVAFWNFKLSFFLNFLINFWLCLKLISFLGVDAKLKLQQVEYSKASLNNLVSSTWWYFQSSRKNTHFLWVFLICSFSYNLENWLYFIFGGIFNWDTFLQFRMPWTKHIIRLSISTIILAFYSFVLVDIFTSPVAGVGSMYKFVVLEIGGLWKGLPEQLERSKIGNVLWMRRTHLIYYGGRRFARQSALS